MADVDLKAGDNINIRQVGSDIFIDAESTTGYDNTVYVDPNGDASVDGKDPSFPTTFANAVSNLTFSTCVILGEGTYTTGGTINITSNNVTFHSLQGGTGSNSIIISDDITVGAGVTRTRWHGIRFDGAFTDNGSDGRHYMAWCSLGGTGSFVRSNPSRWFECFDCDFSSGSVSITGTGANGASTTFAGVATNTPTKTLSATDHLCNLLDNSISAGATITNGTFIVDGSTVLGGANSINSNASGNVVLRNMVVIDATGTPQPITASGLFEVRDTVFNRDTSTLGTEITSNTTYFSADIKAKNILDNTIIVKQVSDFGTIDSTKVYYIDGIIDMGTTSLEVPSGGINIIGSTFDISQLNSTENSYTMFTSPVGGSGNILIENVGIETSGTSSEVFQVKDATGFNAVELNKVNFNDCTSLGSLEEYRQVLENGTGRFGGTPEIELIGSMVGGYRVDTSIARGMSNFTSLFKAGTGFTFAGRVGISINCDLPATGALIDFSASNIDNDESLELLECRITRQGVIDASDTTIFPNIDHTSVKSFWKDNVGVPNTTKYIRSNITTEVTTTISASGTYYPLEGTFTVQENSHFDMPANGEFRLLSGNGVYQFTGDLPIDAGANDVIDIRVTKSTDGGSTYPTELFHIRRQVNSLVGGRDVAFFPISFLATLVEDDRVRLEVENVDDTTDVTAELDSYFIITGI